MLRASGFLGLRTGASGPSAVATAASAAVTAAVAATSTRSLATAAAVHSLDTPADEESAAQVRAKIPKLLVANRGEIACRVMRSAKRMGIKTVAIYSEADVDALHVRFADEAVCVGPAPSADSYLRIDRIVEACKMTGATAVHPGYGFLSEREAFTDALDEAGIIFVGPGKRAIHAMGDKIESKRIALDAGVNTIPGFVGEVDDEDHALAIANEIGYPVMVKASAGGGGKGMRIANNDEEARLAYHTSRNEAQSFFGDNRLLIEKFVNKPRHIEVQVVCDEHGNSVYLNERECSIQRRNQKVIEEAPSPFVDAQMRRDMGEQAVRLAEAVGYRSAGTVECLADDQGNFYFLEMNTRLQVEHPVTEFITGVDIVEQMLRVGAGLPLTVTQDDIGVKGWAMETRVYAEDPFKNFLPSIGRLQNYEEPDASDPNVRVDSGVVEGSEINMFYDPLIAKLVTYGDDRPAAIRAMRDALDAFVISGVTSNIPFCRDVIEHPAFIAGDMTTEFIPQHYPDGFHGHTLSPEEHRQLVLTAACLRYADADIEATVDDENQLSNFYLPAQRTFVVTASDGDGEEEEGEHDVEVHVTRVGESDYAAVMDGVEYAVTAEKTAGTRVLESTVAAAGAEPDSTRMQVLDNLADGFRLLHCGTKYEVTVRSSAAAAAAKHMIPKVKPDMSRFVLSPMPGKVLEILVKPGDVVAPGDRVAVVEAMKMQNNLYATEGGKVAAVVDVGASVAVDETLIEFEAKE